MSTAIACFRRRFVLLALIALSPPRAHAGAEQDGVAMFRGDARHQGVYGAEATDVTGVDLKYKWRFKTGGKIRSTPVVSGELVFVGSEDGNLYAVERSSGKMRWKLATGGEVSSSPAVAGGSVLVVGGDGALYSVDRASGRLRWRFATGRALKFEFVPGDPRVFDYYMPSPTIADGAVYFGSSDGYVYAIRLDGGTLLWKFDARQWVHSTPAVADGAVLVGNYDGELFALDQKTGSLRWRFKVEPEVPGFPVTLVSSPASPTGWCSSPPTSPPSSVAWT